MWVPSTWQTEEDVDRDIILMAEYSVPTPEDMDLALNKVPETILNYRRQMVKNKRKTLNSDIDETLTYVVSGRGGTIENHSLDEAELQMHIREVSGFGYSNRLIEESIKSKSYDLEKSIDEDSNFKLVPASSLN
ncbi:hypothetical protein BDFB_008525 [Asbolus verrucosus]|uniref:Uncharacterized protein n=1 Tax=Asbolus verrucosus TaxID=1661398 RepID=A0A482W3J5_ASBVE|nr:hypothetical protein BDFB_008525 [Asbolus verrucosus]